MKKFILIIILLVAGAFLWNLQGTTAEKFPENLGPYVLSEQNSRSECSDIDSQNICSTSSSIWYRDVANKQIRIVNIVSVETASDLEVLKNAFFKTDEWTAKSVSIGSVNVYQLENHEIAWWTDTNRIVMVQEYAYEVPAGGGESARPITATGQNEVTAWFLSEFPPVKE